MPAVTARVSEKELWEQLKEYLERTNTPDWVMAFEQQDASGAPTKDHVHLYIKDGDSNKIRCALKAAVKRLKLTLNQNAYYSVKFDTKGKGLEYTCKQGNFIAYNGYTLEQLNEAKERAKEVIHKPLPVVAQPEAITNPIVVVNKPSKKPMRQQFIQHLESLGWKKGEKFTAESYEDKREMLSEISDELTDFWSNAFTVPEGERMVRHAMFMFGDENIRNYLKKMNKDFLEKKIFG